MYAKNQLPTLCCKTLTRTVFLSSYEVWIDDDLELAAD